MSEANTEPIPVVVDTEPMPSVDIAAGVRVRPTPYPRSKGRHAA
jgi:hypothetical protein